MESRYVILKTKDASIQFPTDLTPEIILQLCAKHTSRLILKICDYFDYSAKLNAWWFVLQEGEITVPFIIECNQYCSLIMVMDDHLKGFVASPNAFAVNLPTKMHPLDNILIFEPANCEILLLRLKHFAEHLTGSDSELPEIIGLVDRLRERSRIESSSVRGQKLNLTLLESAKVELQSIHADIAKRESTKDALQNVSADKLTSAKAELQKVYANIEKRRKKCASYIDQILQTLRPVDVRILVEYLREVSSSAQRVAGTDAVFVIGATGVGKSSVIHFLAGSRFEVSTSRDGDKIRIISLSEHCDVSTIETCDSFTSKTRFINPVCFETAVLQQFGVADPPSALVLVDSPGFEDTHGPEIDISNGIGMVRAAMLCKSIKILFVCDNQVGSKGGNIASSFSTLSRMLGPNVESYCKAITCAFTKFSDPNSVDEQVEKLCDSVLGTHLDQIVTTLLKDHILVQINDDENRTDLLKALVCAEALAPTTDNFRYFASKDSMDKLRRQLEFNVDIVKFAVRRNEISLAVWKYTDIEMLKQAIASIDADSAEIGSIVESTSRELTTFLTNHVNANISVYNDCVKVFACPTNIFSEDDQGRLMAALHNLVAQKVLADCMGFENIVRSSVSKIECLSKEWTDKFTAYISFWSEMSFSFEQKQSPVEAAEEIKKLSIHFVEMAMLLKRQQELEKLAYVMSEYPCVGEHVVEARLLFRISAAQSVDKLRCVVNAFETILSSFEPGLSDTFQLVVDILGKLKLFSGLFFPFLDEILLEKIQQMSRLFCDYQLDIESVKESCHRVIDAHKLSNAVAKFHFLSSASNLHGIDAITDISEFRRGVEELKEFLTALARQYQNELLLCVPRDLGVADYPTIGEIAPLLEELRFFLSVEDRWQDRLIHHLQKCREALVLGFQDILSTDGCGIDFSLIALAVRNLCMSGSSVQLLKISPSVNSSNDLEFMNSHFLCFLDQLENDMNGFQGDSSAPLQLVDIERYRKLSIIYFQCQLLLRAFVNHNTLQCADEVLKFHQVLFDQVQLFEDSLSANFLHRAQLVLLPNRAPHLYSEVHGLCLVLDSFESFPVDSLQYVAVNLKRYLEQFCEQFKMLISTDLEQTQRSLYHIIEKDDVLVVDDHYLQNARSLENIDAQMELLITTFCSFENHLEGKPAFNVFIELYSSFPLAIVEDLCGEQGKILTLLENITKCAENAMDECSHPALCSLSASVRKIRLLDGVIQRSKRNNHVQYSEFENLYRKVFDRMNQLTNDAKLDIMTCIAQTRFDDAASKIDQYARQLGSEDQRMILDAFRDSGVTLESSFHAGLRIASATDFSREQYLHLQDDLQKLNSFSEACKALNLSVDEINSRIVVASKELQMYFVSKVELKMKEIGENLAELEIFLLQICEIQPYIARIPVLLRPGVLVSPESRNRADFGDFSAVALELIKQWHVCIDKQRDELLRRKQDLPVSHYPSEPPKALLEMLERCERLLDGNERAHIYRRTRDLLEESLVFKLKLMLSIDSDLQSDSSNRSFGEFRERVKLVRQATASLTSAVLFAIHDDVAIAEQLVQQMKAKHETENALFRVLDNIDSNITIFEYSLRQKQFDFAWGHKGTIWATIDVNCHQCKSLLDRKDILGALELAAKVILAATRVVETLTKCRHDVIKKAERVVSLKTLMLNRGKVYYDDGGRRIFLSADEIASLNRATEKILLSSDVQQNLEVFSDDKLQLVLKEMNQVISQQMNLGMHILENVKLENLVDVPMHVAVILLLLNFKFTANVCYTTIVLPAQTRIQSGLKNFHGELLAMSKAWTGALENGTTTNISTLIGTARVLSPTIRGYITFQTQTAEYRFADLDSLRSICFEEMQARLDSAIRNWINLLTVGSFLLNEETRTRMNADRDGFYRRVNRCFSCVLQLHELVQYSQQSYGDLNALIRDCSVHLLSEIDIMTNCLQDLHSQLPSELDSTYIEYSKIFDNLRAISELMEHSSIRFKALHAANEIRDLFNIKLGGWRMAACEINDLECGRISKKDVDSCVNCLIMLKRMSNRLVCYSTSIDKCIDEITESLLQGGSGERFHRIVVDIQSRLNVDEGEHIRSLLQHRAFDEITNILRMSSMKRCKIHHVLGFIAPSNATHADLRDDPSLVSSRLEGEDISYETRCNLFHHWKEFEELYWQLVEEGIGSGNDPSEQMQIIFERVTEIKVETFIHEQIKYRSLLAHIFAYWTLSRYRRHHGLQSISFNNSSDSNNSSNSSSSSNDSRSVEEGGRDFLVQPHPAQVVALFRLLGIENRLDSVSGEPAAPVSSPSPKLRSSLRKSLRSFFRGSPRGEIPVATRSSTFSRQLVEICTGEGKSIVLAVLATVLALLGHTVHCACYSAYLCTRDQNAFRSIFVGFGVAQFIEYGTFGSLCEKILDADGNVREMVQTLLASEVSSTRPRDRSDIANRPRVLLIDEVDVFFNRDYYGRLYEPYATIKRPILTRVAKWLWNNRGAGTNSSLIWKNVCTSQYYNDCVHEFGRDSNIATEMIKGMFMDFQTVMSPSFVQDYLVIEVNGTKVIAYKEQDGYNHNIIKGYQTMFHYLKEHENREISDATLNQVLAGRLYCGGYSYAEIPMLYDELMGVTGTLRQVVKGPQASLLQKYGIDKFTFIPSMYVSKTTFDPTRDVRIANTATYFPLILDEIRKRLIGNGYQRAVFVFFETVEELNAFKSDPEFPEEYRRHALVIDETTSATEKDGKIRAAATTGQIVLLTRALGRGTDFICYDKRLLESGGVHVLQTFLSEQNSEEVQIMGRTGRQGNNGSFSFVLKIDELLVKYDLTDPAILEQMNMGGYFYPMLASARDRYFKEKLYPKLEEGMKNIEPLFVEARKFAQDLKSNNSGPAKRFLMNYNKIEIPKESLQKYRVMVLMDATCSMEPFILMAKNTVKEMFLRLNDFISNQHIAADISIQYVAYRNYNAPPELLLEASAWETLGDNPVQLFKFMDSIRPMYGMGNEAVEVAFSHVIAEDRLQRVNAVVLVGDMPPNTREEVVSRINRNNRLPKWMFIRNAIHYEDELGKFRRDMPVHCFYLRQEAADIFGRISAATRGSCQELNLEASDAPEKLKTCLSLHINRAIGGQGLVDAFRKAYNVPEGYVG